MTGVLFVGVVGQICTWQDGNAFEKAGVSVSVTHGRLTDKRIEYFAPYHPNLKNVVSHKPAEEFPFSVASISLVMHPHNPMVRGVRLFFRLLTTLRPPVCVTCAVQPPLPPPRLCQVNCDSLAVLARCHRGDWLVECSTVRFRRGYSLLS